MGIEDTNVISKKSRRKINKKENKYKHLISQVPGTEYSPEPTKFLMLCNTGLVSGFDEAQAVQIFSEYGRLESVSMLPGKSFCFVTFTDIHDARNAFENVNGKVKLQKMLGPIYMIYTTSAPSSETERSAKRPNGLHVLENFITEEEERNLVNCINFSETTESGNPTLLKNRRVKHYGYEFQYSNNNVNRNEKLPDDLPIECNILQEKLRRHGWENPKWPPHQLTVNEYQPGQGIPPHVDTHSAFESPIMSLSLLSDIVMEFKHADGSHYPLHLPRRSMLIMDGEARYGWTHAIRPRKLDVIYATGPKVIERGLRISFTFRWLREEAVCRCSYRDLCDSQTAESAKNFDSDAARLEYQHVHQVYNKISSHFSQTRYRAWPNVAEFVTSLPLGSVLFDVGCGNGKYFGLNHNIFELGSDRSDGLLAECRQRGGFESVQCDCLRLPLLDRCVDGLICIAVIHHLATRDRRVEAVREMARVLRVGGRGLVYVWAKDQQRGNVQSKYLRGEGVKEGEEVKREVGKEEEVGEVMVKRKKENVVKEEDEEEKNGGIAGGVMVEVGKVEVEEEEENENVVKGMKQGKKEYLLKEKRKKEKVMMKKEKQEEIGKFEVEEEKNRELVGKVKERRMEEGKKDEEVVGKVEGDERMRRLLAE
ncbi:alkylated DNA repair protein alkB homolog 8 [Nilaparvata lugens]|uniref:alkylated DNA repair protein alkB homolog 8 n=1 Tax=Nilaparvata lugens TaxID=108931 RepID=UPI00193D46B9|nr:alkylated DNA repair protein alkB homolog 8 [Nilaparvata lugens]